MTYVEFESPIVWQLGLPLAAVVVGLFAWSQLRKGVKHWQLAASASLRGAALIVLVLLVARPVWVESAEHEEKQRGVVLLVDRSESMSLEETDGQRYMQAIALARDHLLPALKAAQLPVQAFAFADDAAPADGTQLARAEPDGKRTNLSRAILRGVEDAERPPLAVIALTDGAATESSDNSRALSSLLQFGVPFVGIGFGSETGAQTLTLRHVLAPALSPLNHEFRISAQLESTSENELPAFDLLLLRDGQLLERKKISGGKGSRIWLESYSVTETEEGVHTYTVQLLPPTANGLRCLNDAATAAVRISDDKDLRILFAQGALTWDFKFINRALRGDPTIKLTGLSRTSSQSFFYQNIESTGELVNGFPTKLDELAQFRIVVLSNLKPADLSPTQQELLARFCGEFGGGVLLIGGTETFDASWHDSRLEQLLPVRFSSTPFVQGPEQPFRFQPTAEALEHPVFQVTDSGANRAAWGKLPAFTLYARVDSAKPGAQVWARHPSDTGPAGKRVLMATQRYGSGLSAVVCVQNFWRWRLAQDADPQQFDRFWIQLFRFLGEGSREDVAIRFPDQELRPGTDIRVVVEKRPDPKTPSAGVVGYQVRVEDEQRNAVLEQTVELGSSRAVELSFHPDEAGAYTVSVLNAQGAPLASRTVEVKEINVEFQRAARDMENLRQWAGLSGGLALPAEDCRDAREIVGKLKERIEQKRREADLPRVPAGVNGWVLAVLLSLLGGEWCLRKNWGWT